MNTRNKLSSQVRPAAGRRRYLIAMNRTDCSLLDEYLNGWLDEERGRAFEVHLAACPACREEVRLQRRIDELLAAARPTAPPHLAGRVDRALRRRRLERLTSLAAAAAVLFAALIAAWRFSRTTEPERSVASPQLPRAVEPKPHQPAPPPEPDLAQAEAAPARSPELPADPQPDFPQASASAAEVAVAVDAGAKVLVVPEPSDDPTVHIFWLFPTVEVSLDAVEGPLCSTPAERNPS